MSSSSVTVGVGADRDISQLSIVSCCRQSMPLLRSISLLALIARHCCDRHRLSVSVTVGCSMSQCSMSRSLLVVLLSMSV